MNAVTEFKVLAHVQHVARHFLAWRGELSSLIVFINQSLGESAVDPSWLDLFLRRDEIQRELAAHWETALWRASDKTYRLVCLAIPTDPNAARQRLEHIPPSTNCCRYCWIDEKSYAHLDLRPELDIRREIVPGSYLHPQCMRPFLQMRALCASHQTEER